jgi:hypothetical protein
MPYTSRWFNLKVPITYPDHVVIAEMTRRQMTPGTIPRALNAAGIERIPSPICDLAIRTAVPIKPT